jgi:Na+-driven multidrug efflux pump
MAATGTIGICVAIAPGLWLDHFTNNPQVYTYGVLYLSIGAPCYGLFGGGQALYFASQGTGKMARPVTVGVVRFVVVASIGALALAFFWEISILFTAASMGMVTIGLGTLACMRSRAWCPEKA